MIYKKVAKIEEELSVVGMGCWNFGGDWDTSDENNAISIIHSAIDAGINLFDVAPVYGYGVSETILGKALKDGKEIRYFFAANAVFAGMKTVKQKMI